MNKIFLTLAGALIFVSASTVVAQCDCASDLWPERSDLIDKAFSDAAIVFYGQVIAVRKVAKIPTQPNDSNYEAEVFFSVEKAWKKDSTAILRLRQSNDGCVRDFDIGDRWLIYGYYDKEGLLRTGYCHRSLRADQKPELDIEEFRKKGVKESQITKTQHPVTIVLN